MCPFTLPRPLPHRALFQAIVLACCYPQHWPLLVVLPASLRGVWRAELQAWITPELQPPGDHLHVLRSGEELRRLLEAGEGSRRSALTPQPGAFIWA